MLGARALSDSNPADWESGLSRQRAGALRCPRQGSRGPFACPGGTGHRSSMEDRATTKGLTGFCLSKSCAGGSGGVFITAGPGKEAMRSKGTCSGERVPFGGGLTTDTRRVCVAHRVPSEVLRTATAMEWATATRELAAVASKRAEKGGSREHSVCIWDLVWSWCLALCRGKVIGLCRLCPAHVPRVQTTDLLPSLRTS